jgi:hypothetical protein
LREKPLAEVIGVVSESAVHFAECRDFAERMMSEREIPASEFREMQGAAISAGAAFDAAGAARGKFWGGPF